MRDSLPSVGMFLLFVLIAVALYILTDPESCPINSALPFIAQACAPS